MGLIHHGFFKKPHLNRRVGLSTQKLGRTVWGCTHMWIGKILITLGIINGGFGIRLAFMSPF